MSPGAACGSDNDCTAISCPNGQADCPAGATCSGGACTGLCQGGACACASGVSCPGAGAVCDTGPPGNNNPFGFCAGGVCQYRVVPPSDWQLTPGETTSLCMPVGWGGIFWGRTGCTLAGNTLTCETGQCGTPGRLDCSGSGPKGATLFEGTWDSGTTPTDFYDVSLVSGYNLRVVAQSCGTGVTCGRSGQAADGVAGCTGGDLNATCPGPLAVTGFCNCGSDADCGGVPGACQNALCTNQTCVVQCVDPCDACTANANAPGLNCAANQDLYCCKANGGNPDLGNSCNKGSWTCFSDGDCLSGTCQGNVCAPANDVCSAGTCPGGSPAANYSCQAVSGLGDLCLPPADCCGAYNPNWIAAATTAGGGVQPYATTFNQACPSAYAFQYDDIVSSFQCRSTSGPVGYEVSFCEPGSTPGKDGCSGAATFASVECRAGRIATRIDDTVTFPKMRRKLGKLAAKIGKKVGRAETFASRGKRGKVRHMLMQALHASRMIERQLGTKKARRKIPDGARAPLVERATTLRTDLVALRQAQR